MSRRTQQDMPVSSARSGQTVPFWAWLVAAFIWPVPPAGCWTLPPTHTASAILNDVLALYVAPAVLLTGHGGLRALAAVTAAHGLAAAQVVNTLHGAAREQALALIALAQPAAVAGVLAARKLRRPRRGGDRP